MHIFQTLHDDGFVKASLSATIATNLGRFHLERDQSGGHDHESGIALAFFWRRRINFLSCSTEAHRGHPLPARFHSVSATVIQFSITSF